MSLIDRYVDRMEHLGCECRIEPDDPNGGWYAAFCFNRWELFEPSGWIYDTDKAVAVRRAALMAFRRDGWIAKARARFAT